MMFMLHKVNLWTLHAHEYEHTHAYEHNTNMKSKLIFKNTLGNEVASH